MRQFSDATDYLFDKAQTASGVVIKSELARTLNVLMLNALFRSSIQSNRLVKSISFSEQASIICAIEKLTQSNTASN